MKLIQAAAAALALLAAATGASAQGNGATADPAQSVSGAYELDKKHARVQLSGTHMGFSRYVFRLNGFDASLTWDGKSPASSRISVTADPNTADTGLPDFDKEIGGWLGADPIRFVSTRAEAVSPRSGKLYGDLTVNGRTKPAVFDVTFVGAGPHPFSGKPVVGFAAQATIKRSDFAVASQLPAAIFSDEVRIEFDGEFTRR